jgi:hypothetical protein
VSAANEPPEATGLLEAWLRGAPELFRVVRDAGGAVQGFSSLFQPQDAPRALLRDDPLPAAWIEHLRRDPLPAGQRVIFNRHTLAAGTASTAMLWLDTKRAYLELRPDLRRLYVPVADAAAALEILSPLGFAEVPGLASTLLLDFGPGSVDGWLGDVVGRELQAQEPPLVDERELTRLELGVLRHLQRRQGRTVTREELLREVWGHHWTGGSNVVEVVVSSLRRKLRERASALATVRGIGYRLDPLA